MCKVIFLPRISLAFLFLRMRRKKMTTKIWKGLKRQDTFLKILPFSIYNNYTCIYRQCLRKTKRVFRVSGTLD